ncbi:type II toxin-antitoxin system Phd/YefM family antitoxin [Paratractidigestivibacter sp.]|uniref:type II toxin-antitoxin system Phd/YefM family antitoxin n=1 Tax=Paratractidigestivibacter sp. TaxID=2847316 RepID=UPI002ABDB2E8|nr:type II toxin-antitoxin system Phd/YefM family antitoxin [Paratractidigestivibacter sp.]
MRIVSSKTLRNDYSAVAADAHECGEPIFVTRNGAEDLVVMSHEAFLARERMLDERAAVLEAEADYRLRGVSYGLDDAASMLRAARSAQGVA